MPRVLITRFSSFGDVAMLVPVVYSVALAYPQARFTVMTRKAYVPLFEQMNFNVSVVGVDIDKHKGVFGLLKLIFSTTGFKYTHIADMHDVIRTKLIRWSSPLFIVKKAKIDKGRDEKKQMIDSKITHPPLKHTTQRYLDVFRKLGFSNAKMNFTNIFEFKSRSYDFIKNILPEKKGKWIGIAPFARHQGKVLPVSKITELIDKLSQRKEDIHLFLFGGGSFEREMIDSLYQKYPDIVVPFHRMKLKTELILISYLDVMLSMDSANMHLASLCNVPVVSIWGATHPSLGFYGYNQSLDNAVQADLPCRPCSVYGDTSCQFSGDKEYLCMKSINLENVLFLIDEIISDKHSLRDPE